jgi:hypothetical protein
MSPQKLWYICAAMARREIATLVPQVFGMLANRVMSSIASNSLCIQ